MINEQNGQFADIKMVGFDESRTKKYPSTNTYAIHVKLSAPPPSLWSHFFREARVPNRNSLWAEADVRDGEIVVNCPIDQFGHHQSFLVSDVEVANRKYRDHVTAEYKQRAEAERIAKQEHDSAMTKLRAFKF